MILPIRTLMIFPIYTLQVNIFNGYDFVNPIWTIANIDISVTLIVIVLLNVWDPQRTP